MTMHVALFSFSVFFKPMAGAYGWSRGEISAGYSLILMMSGVMMIATGRLTDRLGSYSVLTVCSLCMGAGYILMSRIDTLWQFYFICILIAVGYSGGYGPLLATVARWFVKKRGLMSGIALSGVGLGTAAGPLLSEFLISSCGWRTAYLVVGVLCLVGLLTLTQFLRRKPQFNDHLSHAGDDAQTHSKKLILQGFSLRESVSTRQFWMIWVTMFLINLALHAVMVHAVPYATDRGISSAGAAGILTAVGLSNMLGRIAAGWIVDRLGSKRTLIWGIAMQLISLVLLQFCRGLGTYYLFGIIFGMSFAFLAVYLSPLVAQYFGLKALGVNLGIMVLGANLGGSLGPVIAGYLFDLLNTYLPAFILFGMLSIAGLALAFTIKPPQKFTIKEDFT